MIKSMFHNTTKHTKYVKFYEKIRLPLDTQKEYVNREWPLLQMISDLDMHR